MEAFTGTEPWGGGLGPHNPPSVYASFLIIKYFVELANIRI